MASNINLERLSSIRLHPHLPPPSRGRIEGEGDKEIPMKIEIIKAKVSREPKMARASIVPLNFLGRIKQTIPIRNGKTIG